MIPYRNKRDLEDKGGHGMKGPHEDLNLEDLKDTKINVSPIKQHLS